MTTAVGPAPPNLDGVVGLGGAEVFYIDMPLGKGSLENVRAKFSLSQQRVLLNEIARWMEDGTFYQGSWKKGEIEISGIRRIYTHRFWTEFQVNVLMPPKAGKTEPIPAAFAGIIPGPGIYPGSTVLCIPDPDHIALVELYRFHGLYAEVLPGRGKGWRLEAPRGGKRPDEDHEKAALREAAEEAGIEVNTDSKLHDLGVVEPDSGMLLSSVNCYAVTGIKINHKLVNLDVTEAPTRTLLYTVDEVLVMAANGMITCGITSTMILRALCKGLIRTSRSFGATS